MGKELHVNIRAVRGVTHICIHMCTQHHLHIHDITMGGVWSTYLKLCQLLVQSNMYLGFMADLTDGETESHWALYCHRNKGLTIGDCCWCVCVCVYGWTGSHILFLHFVFSQTLA